MTKRFNVLNLGGEIGYNVEEKFSVITSLNFNQFTGFAGQGKSLGLASAGIEYSACAARSSKTCG